MNAGQAKGLKLRLFGWNLRVWRNGLEYGNGLRGRVILFPWAPKGRRYK